MGGWGEEGLGWEGMVVWWEGEGRGGIGVWGGGGEGLGERGVWGEGCGGSIAGLRCRYCGNASRCWRYPFSVFRFHIDHANLLMPRPL